MQGERKHFHKGKMVSGYKTTSALKSLLPLRLRRDWVKEMILKKKFRNALEVMYELCNNRP